MSKRCWHCKIIKNLSAFYNSKRSNDGKQSMCKECDRLHNKKPNVIFNKASSHLKLTYGITLNEKQDLFNLQNNCCYICGSKIKALRYACIDHCHTTGKIRKLLCNTCNLYLGYYEKYPDLINKFVAYLKENG